MQGCEEMCVLGVQGCCNVLKYRTSLWAGGRLSAGLGEGVPLPLVMRVVASCELLAVFVLYCIVASDKPRGEEK